MGCSIFSSLSSFSTVSGWQIQGSNTWKGMIGLCFLGLHWLFLHLKQSLVQKGSMAPRGCQHPVYSVVCVTCLPCTHPESHWIRMLCGPPGILCSWSIAKTVTGMQLLKWWTHIFCVHPPLMSMLWCPTGLHLKYTSSKIKLLRISRWQQQSINPRVAPYWVWIPWPCIRDAPLKPA